MTDTLTGLMVGMHFRPPAKAVLEALPVGTTLWLRREPENPYDANAVQVLLPGFSHDGKWAELHDGLLATGQWGSEMFTDPLHLGFVDSTKTGMAKIFSEAILEQPEARGAEERGEAVVAVASLGYSLDGKPTVATNLSQFVTLDTAGDVVEDEEEDGEMLDEDDQGEDHLGEGPIGD